MSRSEFICCLLVTILASSTACQRSSVNAVQSKQKSSSCYQGPIEVCVLNPDGTPAAKVPVALGFFLYYAGENVKEKEDAPPPLYFKTPHTDAVGRYRAARWRECMWPTFFYAADESRGLAALQVCEKQEYLVERYTLQLAPARWIKGRVMDADDADRTKSAPIVIRVHPGTRETSRELRTACFNGHFRYLLPPGDYVVKCDRLGVPGRIVPVHLTAGETPLDLGVVALSQP